MKQITKAAFLGSAALLAGTSAASAADGKCFKKQAPKQEKPNVIFLLFDDAGYGDFSCYGQKKTETPVIDALASQGIRFTDMYAAAPLSSPSRCGLMTGLHMGHAQVRANEETQAPSPEMNIWDYEACWKDNRLQGQCALAPGTPTLGSMMQSAGYKTAIVGKWSLGIPGTESGANHFGFDLAAGTQCQRWAHLYYPPALWRNDEMVPLNNTLVKPGTNIDEGADPYDERSYDKFVGKEYGPDAMYREIKNFVIENQKDPFFVMWTTNVPHAPLQCPPEGVGYYHEKYGEEEPLPWNIGQVDTWPHNYYPCRYPRATFSQMISHIDAQMGDMLHTLDSLGIRENTIIIVSSDNGPAVNTTSAVPTKYFQSASPFPSKKGWTKSSLHEGGIRVPFIVVWPAKIKAGAESDHIGYFPDVMPTLADLAGVDCPIESDGVSLAPMLLGKAGDQKEHEYLYFEFPNTKGWVAIRYGKWKGLLQKANKGNNVLELYDIVADPRETTDLAAQNPEIVAKMWEFIRESHVDNPKEIFNTTINFPEK